MKLLDRLNETPPFVLYYLAGAGGKHPGLPALSEKSGLSERTIQRLAKAITWKDVKLGTLDRLCKAIGVDFVACGSCTGAANGPRWFLIKPFKGYLFRIAFRNPKKPLRHLSTLQKQRFMALCQKWRDERAGPF